MFEGSCLVECVEGILLGKMFEEAHDQIRSNAKLLLSFLLGSGQAFDYKLKRHVAACVRLGIEEYLRVNDAICFSLLEIGPSQLKEIFFVQKDRTGGIVDIQEWLEVVEVVERPDLFYTFLWELNFVLLGELDDEFWLEGPLDVQVQFCLRELANELLELKVLVLHIFINHQHCIGRFVRHFNKISLSPGIQFLVPKESYL